MQTKSVHISSWYDWASKWNCLLASASMVHVIWLDHGRCTRRAVMQPHSVSRNAIWCQACIVSCWAAFVNLCMLRLQSTSWAWCLACFLSAYFTNTIVAEVGLLHAFEIDWIFRDSIPWQRWCMQRHTIYIYIIWIYIYNYNFIQFIFYMIL